MLRETETVDGACCRLDTISQLPQLHDGREATSLSATRKGMPLVQPIADAQASAEQEAKSPVATTRQVPPAHLIAEIVLAQRTRVFCIKAQQRTDRA